MSRLLTALLLYRSGYVVGKYVSIERKMAANKDLYYKALEDCQEGWHENQEDVTPFIKYMLRIILAAYRDFEERVDLVSEKLPAKEMVRRAVYGKMGKLSNRDIAELCPSIGIKSVELALKQLVEDGVLLKKGRASNLLCSKRFTIAEGWNGRSLNLKSQPLPVPLKIIFRHSLPDHPIQLHLLWNQSTVNGLRIIWNLCNHCFF